MKWTKRIGFFFLVNGLVMTMVTLVTSLLGLEPHMQQQGLNYKSLMIFCLLWGTGGAFISLWMSKLMAKKVYGVQIIEQSGSHAWIVQAVHQMARQAGLQKMPEVGIFHSPEPNAFATGPSKNNSLVALSSGLLERMDQEQVKGVIGHEVAHIANGDMVTMTLIQGIMNAFVMFFARVVAHLIDNALKDDNGRGGLGFMGYFFVIGILQTFFGILGQFVVSYFSRWREYRADAGGAALAGRQGMISALQGLQKTYGLMEEVQKQEKAQGHSRDAMAALQISNTKGLMALLSTHPPLEERIAALQAANS